VEIWKTRLTTEGTELHGLKQYWNFNYQPDCKNIIMKLNSIISVLLFLVSYPIISQTIPVIPLDNAYEKQLPISTSDFIKSITYVPLETTFDCLIGERPGINVTDKYIIVTNLKKCLLFDRKTGKFIHDIGRYGRGPGEYQSTRGFFNESTSKLYFQGWNGALIKYALEGKETQSIPIPDFQDNFTTPFVPENFDYVDDNAIACNIFNLNGTEKTLIMIFDEKGKDIGRIPNRNVTKKHNITLTTGELKFAHNKDNLLYYQDYNDTVFSVTVNKSKPYLILKRGRYMPVKGNYTTEAINIMDYFESQKFIFFNFFVLRKSYIALYDKSNSKIKVTESTSGTINNTDAFLPFKPSAIFKEELIGIIQCTELMSWFEKNPGLKEKLAPELKAFSSKQPTDNPVIVIAKLKN
jgi:hypothetical protein